MELFRGDGAPDRPFARWLFTAGPVALGAFRNCWGDANALWRRTTFLALGGFDERSRAGLEDWQLFARAALSGATLATVPEALFHYRVSDAGMRLTTRGAASAMVAIAPYLEQLPPALRPLLEVAHAAELRRQEADARAARDKRDLESLLGRLSERLQGHPTLLRAARFCKSLLRGS
jgi:GT2 family glycosyltransferase